MPRVSIVDGSAGDRHDQDRKADSGVPPERHAMVGDGSSCGPGPHRRMRTASSKLRLPVRGAAVDASDGNAPVHRVELTEGRPTRHVPLSQDRREDFCHIPTEARDRPWLGGAGGSVRRRVGQDRWSPGAVATSTPASVSRSRIRSAVAQSLLRGLERAERLDEGVDGSLAGQCHPSRPPGRAGDERQEG
jgi:hypothetical protein